MAIAAPRARFTNERIFFTGMALALLATNFLGFAQTYFLMVPMHAKPLSLMLHLHGALGTAWLLLLVTQTSLVAVGRRDIHRRTGIAGAVIAIAIVLLGLAVALNAVHFGRTNPGTLPPARLLAVQFATISLFATFATLGIINRANAAAHKRFMLLATISMSLPALARIARTIHTWPLPPTAIGGLVLSNVFLIALATYDWRTSGRLHPVTLWGGLAYIICEPLRILIGLSAPWQTFVTTVLT